MTVVEAATLETEIRAMMPDLLAYFQRRLDNREDAADALSETLIVIWRRQRSLPGDAEGRRRYAFGIARNVLAAARRGRVKHRDISDALRAELAVATVPPDLDLDAALAALAEKDRELVLLVAWEGFGVAEAGAILGLRSDVARARYSRARARLRTELAQHEGPGGNHRRTPRVRL